jgi:NADH:ubiquinone oxidoreductase subunit E
MNDLKCLECQQEPTEEELYSQLDDILIEYHEKPGALIPVLQITQRIFGYLPEEALKKISLKLKKSYSEVTGVVSFYSFFSTQPRGKFVVRVCLGTACYVRGGKEVLNSLKKELKIDVGMTTSDKMFSIDVGRCFGACGLAPVLMVNDDVHQRVRPEKIGEILAEYKNPVKSDFKEVI